MIKTLEHSVSQHWILHQLSQMTRNNPSSKLKLILLSFYFDLFVLR